MNFTEEQLYAIKDIKNNLLINAGPGTGKTSIIAEKVSYLIDKGYNPKNILATTFTNKAKDELKYRISKACRKPPHNITIDTIHGFARRIIKEFTYVVSDRSLSILDELNHRMLIINNYPKLNISESSFSENSIYRHIFKLFSFFDAINERFVNIENLKELVDIRSKYNKRSLHSLYNDGVLLTDKEILNIFNAYRKFMWQNKYLDFSQTLKLAYHLLKEYPKIQNILQKRYKYILVDEYQDVSKLQHAIYKLLSNSDNKICFVGDTAQSLYEFRGASSHNLSMVKKDFEKVKERRITKNFRSTSHIISFANSISACMNIEGLSNQTGERQDRNNTVILLEDETAKKSAEHIVKVIQSLYKKKLISSYNDVALLFNSVRFQFIREGYKEVFEEHNIPYTIHKSGNYFEEEPISTLIYLVSLILEKEFFYTSLIELLDRLGVETLSVILTNIPKDKKISFNEISPEMLSKTYKITSKQDLTIIENLYSIYSKIRSNKAISSIEIIYDILRLTPYLNQAIIDGSIHILTQLGYLTGIAKSYINYGDKSILKFLHSLIVLKDKRRIDSLDKKDNSITISTIHSTKGLEYKIVFLCNVNLNTKTYKGFSTKLDIEDSNENPDALILQEKIRLFYTGITRAKDYLFLSYSKNTIYQKPQRLHHLIKESIKHNHIVHYESNAIKALESAKDSVKNSADEQKESLTLSINKINTYISCPLIYSLQYKYNFIIPETKETQFGILIHNVLEYLHSIRETNKKINKAVFKYLKKELDKYDKRDRASFNKLGNEIIDKYIKETYPKIKSKIKYIEKDFEIYFNQNRLLGKVDLILKEEEGLHIIDFKTGEVKDDIDDIKEKQLLLYTLAIEKGGETVKKASIYYLKSAHMQSYKIDRSKLKGLELEIVRIFDELSSNNDTLFYPTPSIDTCSKCYYKIICPHKEC